MFKDRDEKDENQISSGPCGKPIYRGTRAIICKMGHTYNQAENSILHLYVH